MSNKHFDMLQAVTVDVCRVSTIRNTQQCGINEAENIARAETLYDDLSAMRYRAGRFEDMNAEEILDELLDMLMCATNN